MTPDQARERARGIYRKTPQRGSWSVDSTRNFEQMVAAALLAALKEAREGALEEAANICSEEKMGKDIVCPEECAAAIRALARTK